MLRRGATVTGIVEDHDGPADHALIEVLHEEVEPPPGIAFQGPEWARQRVFTDASGVYSLTNVQPGAMTLRASLDGRSTAVDLELSDEQEYCWETNLDRPTFKLEGRLVDENGVGLSDWFVWIENSADEERMSTETDSLGQFSFDVLQNSQFELSARQEASAMQQSQIDPHLVAPADSPWEIRVPEQHRASSYVRGRIQDHEADPIEQLHIAMIRFSRDGTCDFAGRLLKDGASEFRVGPVVPGNYDISVGHGDGSNRIVISDVELSANQELDLGHLQLFPPGQLRLEVLDENQEPYSGMMKMISMEERLWGDTFWVQAGKGVANFQSPGTYWIQPSGGRAAMFLQKVEILPGETVTRTVWMRPGVMRYVEYPPFPADQSVLLVRWFDEDEELVSYRRAFWEQNEEPRQIEQWFEPGGYRVETSHPFGSPRSATFVIDEQDSGEVLVLPDPYIENAK